MRLRSGTFTRSGRWAIGVAVLALVAAGCGVTRVSVSGTGAQGNGASSGVLGTTDDGRYVLFTSDATNLVPGDTNGATDVFRHDTRTGATVRVDLAPNGAQLPAGIFRAVASSDGRHVAFTTSAGLDPADTNVATDVYVRDIDENATTWASQPPAGGFPPGTNVDELSFAISAGGRFVSFFWTTPNLVPELTTQTLYRRDRQAATTTKLADPGTYLHMTVSSDAHHYALYHSCTHGCTPSYVFVDADGSAAGWPTLPFLNCPFDSVSAISADGRYIGWTASYGESPCLSLGRYVVDRVTGTATPTGRLGLVGISRDGKTAVGTGDGDLTPGGTPGRVDLYVRDVPNRKTQRVIHGASGGDQNADITSAAVSPDAHAIAFATAATDLVANDTNAVADVFVWPARAPAGAP
jgi:hypothetical protein